MTRPTVHLYHLVTPPPPAPPVPARWFPGDQYPRALARRVLRRRPEPVPSGFSVVARNLSRGLDRIGRRHGLHTRADPPPPGRPFGILHGPIDAVRELAARGPCVVGPGVLSAPEQWPTMFTDTEAALHVQASPWAADLFGRAWPERVRVWPVGIDTGAWAPDPAAAKTVDVLLYDKVRWDRPAVEAALVDPMRAQLQDAGLSVETIRYGHHTPSEFAAALRRCRALLFVCEHETQGLACEEAMAAGVPVLAWDPGEWADPRRVAWGIPVTPATSVPYFDERCGERFRDLDAFPAALAQLRDGLDAGRYAPRDYVLEHLTLEVCARRYIALLDEAAGVAARAGG